MAPIASDTRGLIRLLTVGAGISAAHIYLDHPLLGPIDRDLATAPHVLGVLPTFTAARYANDIFFFDPLDDRYGRRIVVLWKAVLLRLVSIANCLALNPPLLVAADFTAGFSAAIAQDFALSTVVISTNHNHNCNIGTAMMGLLISIVSLCVFNSIVVGHSGWRAAFSVSAVAIVGLVIVIRVVHSDVAPPTTTRQPHPTLLCSLDTLFTQYLRLHVVAITQAFIGIAPLGFWSTVISHLTSSLGLSTGQTGLLGLAGVADALSASIAGRLSGHIAPGHTAAGDALLMTVTFTMMALFSQSFITIAIGTLILGVGVQAALVSHQTVIYALAPEARSHINAVFMTALFIGMSVGAYGASLTRTSVRWTGLMAFRATAVLVVLGLRVVSNVRQDAR